MAESFTKLMTEKQSLDPGSSENTTQEKYEKCTPRNITTAENQTQGDNFEKIQRLKTPYL